MNEMDKPKVSRPITHTVQDHEYIMNMRVMIQQNPQNLLLREKDDTPMQVKVSIKIADKGKTVTEMVGKDESFNDTVNRLCKIAAYCIVDGLFPTQKAAHIVSKNMKNEGEV